MLFNLETNAGESYNVGTRYPDTVRDLDSRMAQREQAMESNRTGWLQPGQ